MPHTRNDGDIYEVFAQHGSSTPLNHVGSIVSPRRDTAWHLAKETYGRRDDLVTLWVVRRADMIVPSPEDRNLLAAKTRMPHRQPGFPTARRRDRAAAAETAAEIAATASQVRDGAPYDHRDAVGGAGEAGLGDLWLALADDLFVLGNRLGARICDYIDVEEALAVGSIGQEALAHAGTILTLHGFDQLAIDAWFFDREQAQWQVSRAIERLTDWPSTVACGLVVAAAVTVLAEQTAEVGTDPALLSAIAAVREEQLVHLDHWRRWAQALTAWPETEAEFTLAYAEVTELAGDVFGGLPQGIGTGALPGGPAPAAALHERLVALVGGGPGSRLPARPQPRTAGLGGSELADSLARGRVVRDTYAAGVFS
ncbi:Phenylacetic acid catabolic protein [Streptomyces sp. 1331.2]|uniref:Phenylacetic acid catabolic protein n=1 Tax=Streptomyces sp. 1331.2 TaxID=1938835 RepID=UPI000BDBAF69|nr:Phenylacetic acid catabolic protein [Streptomyces sp. 1331.2]SOB81250.1 1,2-phenylacetyl-CoA epoxidase, PaaB subunit [Streptomyces sp. 1331.2]